MAIINKEVMRRLWLDLVNGGELSLSDANIRLESQVDDIRNVKHCYELNAAGHCVLCLI